MELRLWTRVGAAVLTAAVGCSGVALAQAGKPVTFTSQQADRGKKIFVEECVDCHGDDLRGGMNGGPPLRGMAFNQKFAEGAPASALFLFMSTTMPPNDPGRYAPGDYAELMAYILEQNGFQSGAPLPSDESELDNLIVEK